MSDLLLKYALLTPETKISLISALIACIAAIIALSQADSARRSYLLSKQVYDDGQPNIDIHDIAECKILNNPKDPSVYYYLFVIIKNLSDKPSSIIDVKFQLICKEDFVFCASPILNLDDLPILKTPSDINAHATKSGWLVFEVPRSIYDNNYILTHFLVLSDIHGLVVKKEQISIRESVVVYEK